MQQMSVAYALAICWSVYASTASPEIYTGTALPQFHCGLSALKLNRLCVVCQLHCYSYTQAPVRIVPGHLY